ncbi:hypothetical protein D3C77_703440 [compost metagenome]
MPTFIERTGVETVNRIHFVIDGFGPLTVHGSVGVLRQTVNEMTSLTNDHFQDAFEPRNRTLTQQMSIGLYTGCLTINGQQHGFIDDP